MKRPSDPKATIHADQIVHIQYVERCNPIEGGCRPERSCGPCEFRRLFEKLTPALTSHYARDPQFREEFLDDYLALVQFYWARSCERGMTRIQSLPAFFHAYREHIQALKHLTLGVEWRHTGLPAGIHPILDIGWGDDDNFRIDAFRTGMLFGILHKYRIKAEVTSLNTNKCRLPFLKCVEELCKERLDPDGEPFWETLDRGIEDIFRNDEELRRCADQAVETETANRQAWLNAPAEFKYDVDFSA
jgi:hypothetical protein